MDCLRAAGLMRRVLGSSQNLKGVRRLWRGGWYVHCLVGMVSQMYIMSNLANVYFEYVQVILCQLQLDNAV